MPPLQTPGGIPSPSFFLVDGMSQVYRAFFAIRNLSNSKGLPTNAVYGFINMLLRLRRVYNPDLIGVIYDTPEPTFRHKAFEAYKAHRKPIPPELAEQLPYVKKACDILGIKSAEAPGFEADDIIGTLTVKAREAGYYPVIVSNDKDLLQVVQPGVFVLQSKKNEDLLLDEHGVEEHFGVAPNLVPDVLALWGDASDNIPGVPGIGEKRAKDLIRQFGTLEDVIARAGEIRLPSIRSLLEQNVEAARFSRDMVVVRCDLDVDFRPEEYRPASPDRARAFEFFTEMEFEGLRKEFISEATATAGAAELDCRCVTDAAALRAEIEALRAAGSFALAVLADSTDPMRASLLGLAVSCERAGAAYVPLAHRDPAAPQGIPVAEALAVFRPLLEDETVAKVGHDVKSDTVLLARNGIRLRGVRGDAMLASYLLSPDSPSHSLPELALRHLGARRGTLADLAVVDGKAVPWNETPIASAFPHAAEGADLRLRLCEKLHAELASESLDDLYESIEVPLTGVLAAMQLHGVRIDVEQLRSLGTRVGADLAALEQEIYTLSGERFNIQSPAQLGEVLFDKLGLPARKRTAKQRRYSTDTEVLTELAGTHALPRKILDFRMLSKLQSTYIVTLEKLVNPVTGRLHTTYNQAVTATGRLSSSDPNLQNIPIRTPLGREIRRAFVADEGFVIVASDYSQIELRILAHVSRDARLCEAFERNDDIHTATASEVFDVPAGLVPPELRRRAKVINFGILYGMSPFGLSRELGIGQTEARAIIDRYFDRYPGVRAFIEQAVDDVRRTGTTRTLFNRIRRVPEISSKNASVRSFAERVAVNTPIQGTAADLIKAAMVAIQRDIETRGSASRMIMQVHDELVFEIPEALADDETKRFTAMMEHAHPLAVPLVVDVKTGKTWLG